MNNKFKKLRRALEIAQQNLRYAEQNCVHTVKKDGEYATCLHCGTNFGQWIFYDYPNNYPHAKRRLNEFKKSERRPRRRRLHSTEHSN